MCPVSCRMQAGGGGLERPIDSEAVRRDAGELGGPVFAPFRSAGRES